MYVEEGAEIYNSVIMADVHVAAGAKIYYSIVDSDCFIGENVTVGAPDSQDDIKIIAKGTKLTNDSEEN